MKIIFLLLLLLSSISLHASPSCQAKYDEMGIPHQEVTSNKEFYYCFGFHHGKDRAWQMDFFRRFAYGTNAEVLGYKFIKNDFMMRLLDLPKLAARLYEELSIESKELLQNYTEGVNEGFKEGKLSDEFIKLGFTPAKWEPLHSIAVLLLQSFDQTKKTFFFDIKEQEKLDRYPDAKKLFDENETPWLTTILKEGEYQTQETRGVSAPSHNKSFKLWAAFPELFGRKSGSNNWVVNSNYTKNKVAILANDPHLDLKTPSFWYWVHLKSQDNQVIGASLPGLPFVASGTNGKVSWGLTNSYLNSADSIEITDIDKKDITSVRPVIWFKFGFFKLPFFFKSIEKFNETYPVLPLEVPQRDKVVLRWSGYTLK
ncbi:MAG: penicillin acylase family protein, partial [Bacteriovoracaceae bacterium]